MMCANTAVCNVPDAAHVTTAKCGTIDELQFLMSIQRAASWRFCQRVATIEQGSSLQILYDIESFMFTDTIALLFKIANAEES